MTIPSGNGETRGPESAGGPGTPSPSRPARARANNEKYKDFLGAQPVADQAGFGTEDFQRSANFMDRDSQWQSAPHNMPPHLMSLGDPGETFGGS